MTDANREDWRQVVARNEKRLPGLRQIALRQEREFRERLLRTPFGTVPPGGGWDSVLVREKECT